MVPFFLLLMSTAIAAFPELPPEHPQVTVRKHVAEANKRTEDSYLWPPAERNADGVHPTVAIKQYLRRVLERIEDTYTQEEGFVVHANIRQFTVNKVDEKNSNVKTTVAIAYNFVNPYLFWNASEHRNYSVVKMTPKELYAPQFYGCEGFGHKDTIESSTVSSDGRVDIVVKLNMKHHCSMTFDEMPYDSHSCAAEFYLDITDQDSLRGIDLKFGEAFKAQFMKYDFDLAEVAKEYKRLRIPGWENWSPDMEPPRQWNVSSVGSPEIVPYYLDASMKQVKLHYTISRNPAFWNWAFVYITLAVSLVVIIRAIFSDNRTPDLIIGIFTIVCAFHATHENELIQRRMAIFLLLDMVFLTGFTLIALAIRDHKKKQNKKK